MNGRAAETGVDREHPAAAHWEVDHTIEEAPVTVRMARSRSLFSRPLYKEATGKPLRHVLMAALSLGAVLSLLSGALAAPMIVTQQKVAGPYRVQLRIGPTEMMGMHMAKGAGERMLGGKNSTCRSGGHSAMPTMPSSHAMCTKVCNHHVEVHIYTKRTGQVVTHARVTISMRDAAKHMTIMLPIMTMVGMHAAMSDYHYGNNVYAGPGRYTVKVTVNGTAATFSVDLM